MTNPEIDRRAYRLRTIDLLRGLAIVVMALDHVRDFFMQGAAGDPMAGPEIGVGLYATRWITHFCAPTFVLLAGASAGLMAARKSPRELGAFLCKRGLWLILVEWFVVSTAFTFAPWGIEQLGGRTLVPMQVIWAIGASMVVLAAAQRLGRGACLAIGAAILLGHNALDPVWPTGGIFAGGHPLWVALHAQMAWPAGPFLFVFLYPLLPWTGVMLVGFGISEVFELPPARRNALLGRAGGILVVAFCLLRAIDLYGDPNGWHVQPAGWTATVMDFLNTTKYPPSLLFLCMVFGPTMVLAAFADRLRGFVADTLVMFGRVPFAFYVTHFVLIHAASLLFGVAQGFEARQFCTMCFFYPPGFGTSLPGVYLVWALVLALLYPFCRWVAAVKARRSDWWLSYL